MTSLVFLIDVDNTLIANDDVKRDFDAHLQVELGPKLTARFWELYERHLQKWTNRLTFTCTQSSTTILFSRRSIRMR
jgi:hypothetical protein